MKFKNALQLLKRPTYSFEDVTLCGVPLKTVKNTIRKQPDQDDAWWFYLAKHHNTIFDIGCNAGYTALLALISNPDKYCVLVDPNAAALNVAHLNLIKNNLGFKAHFYCGFVDKNSNQSIKFYTIGLGEAGSKFASHAKTASTLNSHTQVNSITLDDLTAYYGTLPDLVKVDVEGAELEVLEGSYDLVSQSKCKLFVEMHKLEDLGMEASGNKVLDWCKKTGYKAWYLKTGEELSSGFEIRNRGKCHLLLMPEKDTYPDYLKGIKPNAQLPKIL